MRLQNLATHGWLGMLLAALFAVATVGAPDTASAQRGGGGGGRGAGGGGGGRGAGGGGNGGGGGGMRSGGGGMRAAGGGGGAAVRSGANAAVRAGGGGAVVQSRATVSAQPRANTNAGGNRNLQTGGNSNAQTQSRVNAQPRVDANVRGNAKVQGGNQSPRTFAGENNKNDAVRSNLNGNARGNAANDLKRGNVAGSINRGGNQNREPNFGAQFSQSNNRLTVNNVTSNSASAKVGLRDGDQIVSVGGRNVNSQRDFQNTLGSYGRGGYGRNGVPIVVRRNGGLQTLYWTGLAFGLAGIGNGYGYGYGPGFGYGGYGYGGYGIGGLGYYGGLYGPYRYGVGYRNGGYNNGYGYYSDSYASSTTVDGSTQQAAAPQPDPNAPFLGVVLDSRYGTAAVVRDVYSFSPADTAGLQPGDTITRVNDQPVSAPNDLSAMLTQMPAGSKVALDVTGPNPRTVEVTLSTRAQAQQALEAARPKLQEGEGLPTPQDVGGQTQPAGPPELPQPSDVQ